MGIGMSLISVYLHRPAFLDILIKKVTVPTIPTP
jgi:hypothetical protein